MTFERDEEAERAALDHCRCNLSITQNACPIAERAYLAGVQFQKERENQASIIEKCAQVCELVQSSIAMVKKDRGLACIAAVCAQNIRALKTKEEMK